MRTKERTGAPRLVGDGSVEDGRRAISLAEAAALIGCSRSTAYAAARSGDIPTIKVLGRVFVPVAALERLLSGDPDQ